MGKDERVLAAIEHWAPRFVSNGVPLADFQEVTSEVDEWEQWCAAWSRRAKLHEDLGRDALAEGHHLTAGEHLTRAGVCYHFGKFLFVVDPEQMRAAHERSVACRTLALPHLSPPGERVEIPFDGTVLAGNLRRPPSAAPPPVVAMIMGLDSAKEEMDSYESTFLARGMATLSFDGPGQGEAEYDLAIRGDYEAPVKAVVDWLRARDDVDGDRIGLWGVSLGGYYAPRAAAFEPRVRACISLAGPFDFAEGFDELPSLTRDVFRVRSHVRTDEEAREHGATLSLAGVAPLIACPLLVVFGKQDRLIPYQAAERLAAEASGPTTLLMIEDGNHVANNRGYRYRSQSADWMADQLGVAAVGR